MSRMKLVQDSDIIREMQITDVQTGHLIGWVSKKGNETVGIVGKILSRYDILTPEGLYMMHEDEKPSKIYELQRNPKIIIEGKRPDDVGKIKVGSIVVIDHEDSPSLYSLWKIEGYKVINGIEAFYYRYPSNNDHHIAFSYDNPSEGVGGDCYIL